MEGRILISGQDREGLNAFCRLIEKNGFGVTSVQTASAVLRELERGGVALVVTDSGLADADALGLLLHIRRIAESVPVIMIAPSARIAAELVLGGADDALTGPVSEELLLRTVLRALAPRPPAQPSRKTGAPGTSLGSASYVRGLRLWTGLTQERFAAVIGYQARTVSKWESGQKLATHAQRAMQHLESLRSTLVARMGWRGSTDWLGAPSTDLHGERPIAWLIGGQLLDLIQIIGTPPAHTAGYAPDLELQVCEASPAPYGKMSNDVNYQAYSREAAELESRFPGHLVAYSDGAMVAVGRDARELLQKIPPGFERCPLFIKDIPEKTIRLRRPFRMPTG